ncbi:YadA-like family protein [Salmonella enterica]|nr:YadA-like family protein [Salmonella enterica]
MKPLLKYCSATAAMIISLWAAPSWGSGLDGGQAAEGGVAIGPGANAADESVAIGKNASTGKFNSLAIGENASTAGGNSISIGYNSSVQGDINDGTAIGIKAKVTNSASGSVALGNFSIATRNNEVSIGGDGISRILSNVTDGTETHDAVNVGQLETAKNTIVAAANKHTDTEITALDGKAQEYANTAKDDAVTVAKKYTDEASLKANEKILTEANTYTDTAKSSAIDEANKHTDTEITTLDGKAQVYANTAKDEAVIAANKHTNTEITALDGKAQAYANTAKDDAVTAANKYTDQASLKANEKILTVANTYTDTAKSEAVKEANQYSDDTAKKTLKSADDYTDESSLRTLESANTYTNHRSVQAENNAVARSNAYTDNRFGELKHQVDRNEKRANGGIAGAMAMTAIPSVPGHDFSFGMATSGYRGQGAIAAGVKANITQNTTVSLNTAWDSGNGVGVAAGFSVGW